MHSEVGQRFRGRVAFVTGVNDRGFGGAIAERLAREGGSLVLVDLQKPERLLRRLDRLGAPYLWQDCDITVRAQIETALRLGRERFGQFHAVINSAGIGEIGPIEQLTEEQCTRAFDVNLTGTFRVVQCALPHLAQISAIVNVASAMGLNGCKWYSIYSASKAGLIGMTQSLAAELAERGVRVNCVAPALAHTPMVHRIGEYLTPEVWRQIRSCQPLGVGSPHDVAAAVAFLASEEAGWITGVTLPLGWMPSLPLPVDALNGHKQERIFPVGNSGD